MSRICKAYGFILYSYEQGQDIISILNLGDRIHKTDGFSTYHMEGISFFITAPCQALACVLPLPTNWATFCLTMFTEKKEKSPLSTGSLRLTIIHWNNKQMYSLKTLAPACVLHELGVSSAQEISDYCKISKCCADYRAARLKLLNNHEQQFFKERGASNYACPTWNAK